MTLVESGTCSLLLLAHKEGLVPAFPAVGTSRADVKCYMRAVRGSAKSFVHRFLPARGHRVGRKAAPRKEKERGEVGAWQGGARNPPSPQTPRLGAEAVTHCCPPAGAERAGRSQTQDSERGRGGLL